MSKHVRGKRARRLGLALPLLIIGLAMALFIPSALAVHDEGLFELDLGGVNCPQKNPLPPLAKCANANVADDNLAAGDDWANVANNTDSAFASAFIEDGYRQIAGADPLRLENSFYTEGGSKDTNGIQDGPWKYDTTNDQVPDNDDIVTAFAAAYTSANDLDNDGAKDTIIYFGADRFDGSGESVIGFWFFRSQVGLGPKGADGKGLFTGQHQPGDTLIVADFRNGGAAGEVSVFEWVGDDATGSLQPLSTLSQADCGVVGNGDPYCAGINQTAGENPPWAYLNKDGGATYQVGGLFEGGINLDQVLNRPVGCFSSFLAETRATASTTSQLKDFALGEFPFCGITVEKKGDPLSKVGDSVDYQIKVTNTGKATLYKQSIVDDVLGDLTNDAGCGASLAAGASCTINVSRTVLGTDPDPLKNTVTIKYTEFQDFTGVAFTETDDHTVELFQPKISFSKTVDTTKSKVGDKANYTLTLKNESSSDTPKLVCTVTDGLLGVDKSVTLASSETDETKVAYTFKKGDTDPFVNTAKVSCKVTDFSNVLDAQGSATVDLFQPSIAFSKAVDVKLSKIGDKANYTITLKNTSSPDTPDLVCTINDAKLGIVNLEVTLKSGDPAYVKKVEYTFKAGDADPFVNTAKVSCKVTGFSNVLDAQGTATVDLFQPSITFTKTADTKLSKVTDIANYTITLTNTSSPDTPDLACTINDATLGIVNLAVTLKSGDPAYVKQVAYTFKAGDADPFVNTADVSCKVTGFSNVLTAKDSWTVELFQPSIKVTKTGPDYSKAGDTAKYTVKIENTSSDDTPDLVLDSVKDSLAGDLTAAAKTAGCDPLKYQGSCSFDYSYVVKDTDVDPLVNTVEAHYHPTGFKNDITASGKWSTDLLHPKFKVTKVCSSTQPVPQEGPAKFKITYSNTGDADLVFTPSEGSAVTVAAGQSTSVEVTIDGPFSGKATVSNTVTGTVTLDPKYKLDNKYEFKASDSCRVGSRVNLKKLTQGVVNQNQVWKFEVYKGPDGFGTTALASDSTATHADGVLNFGNLNLDPLKTYTVCELSVPSGWTAEWMVDTDGDGIVDQVIVPYNPNANDPVPEDLGNRCFDFGAGTGYPLTAGGTLVFQVDNKFPGGAPRTPGYWKNWNRCTGGGQAANADRNGGRANGFTLLEDILTSPGIIWDDILADLFLVPITTCEQAVEILDQRVVTLNGKVGDGKKLASDGARTLAMHLLAAQLNEGNGACINQDVKDVILAAEKLLDKLDFDGTKTTAYLTSKSADYAYALTLAKYLDAYNNSNCDFGTLPPKPTLQ